MAISRPNTEGEIENLDGSADSYNETAMIHREKIKDALIDSTPYVYGSKEPDFAVLRDLLFAKPVKKSWLEIFEHFLKSDMNKAGFDYAKMHVDAWGASACTLPKAKYNYLLSEEKPNAVLSLVKGLMWVVS